MFFLFSSVQNYFTSIYYYELIKQRLNTWLIKLHGIVNMQLVYWLKYNSVVFLLYFCLRDRNKMGQHFIYIALYKIFLIQMSRI